MNLLMEVEGKESDDLSNSQHSHSCPDRSRDVLSWIVTCERPTRQVEHMLILGSVIRQGGQLLLTRVGRQ
jgi:hypothetical protein